MLLRPGCNGHVVCHLQYMSKSRAPAFPSRDVSAAAKKQKPQKKKLRKPKTPVSERIYVEYEPEDDNDEDSGRSGASVVLVPGTKAPRAPATADRPSGKSALPEELYPVFPKPQSSVSSLDDGKWSWGEDRPSGQSAQQDVPMWNPKTGFMKTRAQIEAQQQTAEAPAAVDRQTAAAQQAETSSSAAATSSSSSSGTSNSSSRTSTLVEPLPQVPSSAAAVTPLPAVASGSSSSISSSTADLPAVSREQVLGSCLTTSLGMAAAAAGLHVFAQQQSSGLLGTDQAAVDQLLRLPLGLESATNAAFMLAAAAGVTAARFALLQVWPDFADATERSNKQVLSPLGWPEIAAVAVLSGVSEELLFRGGLIPATLPDYRGVLLSGAVFGLLHVSGGRNLAFAGWATVVGWLYGAVFLATSNIWVAAGAHSLANFASAAVWLSRNGSQGKQQL